MVGTTCHSDHVVTTNDGTRVCAIRRITKTKLPIRVASKCPDGAVLQEQDRMMHPTRCGDHGLGDRHEEWCVDTWEGMALPELAISIQAHGMHTATLELEHTVFQSTCQYTIGRGGLPIPPNPAEFLEHQRAVERCVVKGREWWVSPSDFLSLG